MLAEDGSSLFDLASSGSGARPIVFASKKSLFLSSMNIDSSKELQSYGFDKHRHIFSAWCGSTAAGASPLCRFRVAQGKEILEAAKILPGEFDSQLSDLNLNEFDTWHDEKCTALISHAKHLQIVGFEYGVAAKMLNCYLKAYYASNQTISNKLHPPIDRILLTELATKNVGGISDKWRNYKKTGWSKFQQADYLDCIKSIRASIPMNMPLWKIEYYWKGHQTD